MSSLHVLLALVAMVWGHDCDFTSHLATKAWVTKAKVTASAKAAGSLISEFRPSQPDAGQYDPQQVEISGTPSADFSGCIWAIDAVAGSGVTGMVIVVLEVSGTFDANGLLVVDIFKFDESFERPSFTIFLSARCPDVGEDIFSTTRGGAVINESEPIYDSIGVPADASDQVFLEQIRTAAESFGSVPGTDLTYVDQLGPIELVFRDASVGEVYAVALQYFGPVYDANGNELIADDFDYNPLEPTFGAINPTRGSAVIGDPRITFKGDHDILLREGSFLLWHFALKQPQVEWQIFASGRQSFTKGLLLVDTSGPKSSIMEITSKQCQWQTPKKGNSKEWLSIKNGELLPTGPSSHLKLVGNKTNAKKVQFFIADEKIPVATLKVVCQQGHHMNVKLHMANQKWGRFVSGQLQGTKQSPSSKKISMLQLEAKDDQEFEVKKTWEELDGSPHGQQYLESSDQNPKI